MPTPTRHPHRPAVVVALAPLTSARGHRSAAAAEARRLHPSARRASGRGAVISFRTPTEPPGWTP